MAWDALTLAPEAVIVLPVDHPDVRPATVASLGHLMHAARQHTPARERRALSQALVPRHRGRRGHPVALTAALARRIADDSGAADLSDAIRRTRACSATAITRATEPVSRGTTVRVRAARPRAG